MKFTIQRETLLRPLQLVSGAVERRQTLPILSNVLLVVKGTELSMTATDLEVELIGRITLESIDEEGEITVTARKLIDICKTLPDEANITLKTEKDRVIVRSGKSRFILSTLPASDFPNVEETHSQVAFALPQAKLKQLLEKTYFSMAQQDVRYYLNGMLFDINKKILKVVATDGHRLALANLQKVDINKDQHFQVIIPRKGIIELMRLLEDVEDSIEISIGTNHICAKTPEFTFTSKLVEGKFPDYRRVIPKNGDKIVTIDHKELKKVLTRVSILSNEKFRGIRMMLSSGVLRLFANNPEQEEAEDEVSINYKGPDLEIGFNVNYLLDICNTILTEQMKMIFSDSNGSLLIEPVGNDEYLYVVMPMRL